jgi:hypothetical protein
MKGPVNMTSLRPTCKVHTLNKSGIGGLTVRLPRATLVDPGLNGRETSYVSPALRTHAVGIHLQMLHNRRYELPIRTAQSRAYDSQRGLCHVRPSGFLACTVLCATSFSGMHLAPAVRLEFDTCCYYIPGLASHRG